MPIDPSAVGARGNPQKRRWGSKDALLYSLGVGAGLDELAFTTENTAGVPQRVLPTFAVIVGMGGAPFDKIGSYNPAMLVHGEQGIELYGEIPVAGEIELRGECTSIYDKGSGAAVTMESVGTDLATGKPLLKTSNTMFIRGEGGFGGERGPSAKVAMPDRAPDEQVTYATRADQALLYRLNGDRNPLHSDPGFAKKAGFEAPILHGLCTYGFTGRALLHAVCGGDPARFRSMHGRFSKPVVPGDDLLVSMWVDGNACLFQTRNGAGDVVFDQGRMQLA